ncbi:MAG TPA: peptide deformylase [Anaerolineae bacterium]|nr:peptide deformylase [Anaerolineae bacterium]
MTKRTILTINDPRLRQKAKRVKQFTPSLKKLAQDMLETMRGSEGVGLAGPQVGVMQRIFVAEIPLPKDPDAEPHPQSGRFYVLVNPEIVKSAAVRVEGKEGCLSIPDLKGLVERPEWVEVRAQDLEGRRFKLKVDDLLGRIFQHEIDHLNGILYLDHITDPAKLWRVTDEAEAIEATEPGTRQPAAEYASPV